MRQRSRMAWRLLAMGRRSPWARTLAMCSSGLARSQMVKTFAEQAIEIGGIGDDAATGGQYKTRMFGENGFEGCALHAAITAGAVEVKDDGEGDTGVALDL